MSLQGLKFFIGFLSLSLLLCLIAFQAMAAGKKPSPVERIYHLTVDYKKVNFVGKAQKAMAINGSIPAPALYFKKGEKAVIYVRNKMDEETSIHWHGLLLPNFQDGAPYLTSPPIRPGKSHKFEFVIRQDPGTYWYHSHTGLQEQRGLYGAFIIEEEPESRMADLPLILSDWTDKDPKEILRSLKRGDHYPAIQKGTLPGLFEVIARGAFLDLFQLWKMRMEGADISDVYYPLFLINGKTNPHYKDLDLKPGGKLRLRVINGSASTYFWLSFGGKSLPLLVAADGLDVQPVPMRQVLHAVAETYDFILQIPEGKSLEFKAMAQDGSGQVIAVIGKRELKGKLSGKLGGELEKAPDLKKPDRVDEIRRMAALHKKHAGGHKGHSGGHTADPVSDSGKEEHKGHNRGRPVDSISEPSGKEHNKGHNRGGHKEEHSAVPITHPIDGHHKGRSNRGYTDPVSNSGEPKKGRYSRGQESTTKKQKHKSGRDDAGKKTHHFPSSDRYSYL